jgi:hypothetical protein
MVNEFDASAPWIFYRCSDCGRRYNSYCPESCNCGSRYFKLCLNQFTSDGGYPVLEEVSR